MAIDSSPSVNVVSKPSVGSGLSGLNLTGVGSVVGAVLNPFLQWQQNRYNQRLMEQQNQWNLEQWQRETAYNSPSAQMQRLAAAGINPALAFSQGQLVNEAAASPQMQASQGRAPQVDASLFAQLDLMQAQADNLRADSEKKRSETEYQGYINAVEKELQDIVVDTYSYETDEGLVVGQIRGNARVEIARRELEALGLENKLSNAEFQDMLFDFALLSGLSSYPSSDGDYDPTTTPGYTYALSAMRGDQEVRRIAGELAKIEKEYQDAQKAGSAAYSEWLKENADKPVVKFFLALQGFLQSVGFRMPSISTGSYSGQYNGAGNRAGWRSTSTRKGRNITIKR